MRRGRWQLLLVAALSGLVLIPSTALGDESVTAEAFLDRVDRASALAALDGAAPSVERMTSIRSTLGLPVTVVVSGWTTVVPSDPVLDRLTGASTEDFSFARDRLETLSRSISDVLAGPRRDRTTLTNALDAAFRGVVPPRPDPLSVVLRSIGDALQAILGRLGHAVGAVGNVLGWVVLLGILAVAAVAAVRVGFVPDRRSRAKDPLSAGDHRVDWVARGEAALRAGDPQEAIRAFYIALLVVLAARGIVSDAPALTAGEARLAVGRARPELFGTIAQATETYERVVYGGATPGDQDVQALRQAATRVRTR